MYYIKVQYVSYKKVYFLYFKHTLKENTLIHTLRYENADLYFCPAISLK